MKKEKLPPRRYDVPPDARKQSCLSCGQPIYWIETQRGKRCPVDPDGTTHFATCDRPAAFSGKTRAEASLDLFGAKK